MRFYSTAHRHYCGIDLHARTMCVCIVNDAGETVLHRNMKTGPDGLAAAIEPYREDRVISVECLFTWYWLADWCAREGIAFVLGHALYLKAIHGGKAKNDRIDSEKIARLLKAGLLPQAYAYPARMRATRDLLRRRMMFARYLRIPAHIQNTVRQYNLPPLGARAAGRIRAVLLQSTGGSSQGGLTQSKQSPEKPGRFTPRSVLPTPLHPPTPDLMHRP